MSMYRRYEDPYKLEQALEELKNEYETAKVNGASFEELSDLYCSIEELKERINFAWQDDEYESEY